MRTPISTLASVAVAVIGLSGCSVALNALAGPKIQGSGVAAEETRSVPEFRSIRADAVFEVAATVGPERKVVVRGDDNLLPLVETVVENGTLVIRFQSGHSIQTMVPMQVTLSLPALESITADGAAKIRVGGEGEVWVALQDLNANGASRVEVARLATAKLRVKQDGAAVVRLSGAAEELDVDLNGASKLQADGLVAKSATLKLDGASRAEVHAEESVAGEARGASRAVITGQPARQNIDSSGAASYEIVK